MSHYPSSGRFDLPMTVDIQTVTSSTQDFAFDCTASREDIMAELKHAVSSHSKYPEVMNYLIQFVDWAITCDSNSGVAASRFFFFLPAALRVAVSSRKQDNTLYITTVAQGVLAEAEFLQCEHSMRSLFGKIRGWSCFYPRPPTAAEQSELQRLLVWALEDVPHAPPRP